MLSTLLAAGVHAGRAVPQSPEHLSEEDAIHMPPRAGSTPRLDRSRIVAAAVELSEVPDWNSVSFRRLGAKLGVDPTALYRHFHRKEDLLDAALDHLYGVAASRVDEALPWRARLQSSGDHFVDVLASHPAIGIEAGRRRTGGPGEAAIVEVTLACLEEAGLGPADAARFWGMLATLVWAFAADRSAARLAAAADPERLSTPLAPPPEIDRYPALGRHIAEIAGLDWGALYEEKGQLLLDAIERTARNRDAG